MRFSIVFTCLISVLLLGYVLATEFVDSPERAAIEKHAAAPAVAMPDVSGLPIESFQGDIIKTKGAVNYFVSKCSICHGPEDTAYRQIKTPRRGDALKTMIRTMASGPAMAPIGAADLEAQLKLHEDMLDGKPYAWLGAAKGDVMPGETISGTEITLVADGKQIKAYVSGYRFVLPNLEGELILKREGKEIRQPTGPR